MKKTLALVAGALLLGGAVGAQTALPTIPDYVSRDGLVGWWEFSGNAGDSSGKGNHGVLGGDTKLTTDRKGVANSAYEFDGNGDYVNVPDHATLRCRHVTMAAWVRQQNSSVSAQNQVIYKGKFADGTSEAYSMNMKLQAGVKMNSGCQISQGWQIVNFGWQAPVNFWVHIVTTFDGDSIRTYLNGMSLNKTAAPGKIDSCVGSDLRFGFNHNLYGGDAFRGGIDDIGIWNRALSPAEVNVLYTGIPIPNNIGLSPENRAFSMYPNPARSTVTLSRNGATGSGLLQVSLSDITGRLVVQETFTASEKVISLPPALSSGLYLITVADAQGKTLFREKLILE